MTLSGPIVVGPDLSGYSTSASPAFTGTPTAPTAAVDTNTTQIATTAFVIGQGYAKLAGPTFTGVPASPTAAVDTNTTQIASTAFVLAQAASAAPVMDGVAAVGTSTRYARGDHVHATDTTLAPKASPTFTGTPLSTTAAADTNTTQIATTAYVVGQGYAKLASPTLTGTPASTTAAVDTNTTQIATTAFVVAQAGATNPVMNGTVTVGTSKRYSREDHVHATDTSLAPKASPTFTGTVTTAALTATGVFTQGTAGNPGVVLGADGSIVARVTTSGPWNFQFFNQAYSNTVSGLRLDVSNSGDANLYTGTGRQFAFQNAISSTNQISATDGLTTKIVAGVVSDGSFTTTPPSGTLAIDTTNSKIYVRVGSTWKSVTVA